MKTIADLTIKQLQQLSRKKFQSKKKFFERFDKDPLERLSLSSLKNLAKKRKPPFQEKKSRAGFSLERKATASIKIHCFFQIKTIQRFLRSPGNCRNDFPRWKQTLLRVGRKNSKKE